MRDEQLSNFGEGASQIGRRCRLHLPALVCAALSAPSGQATMISTTTQQIRRLQFPALVDHAITIGNAVNDDSNIDRYKGRC
jgi:hypothetical protein